MKKSHVKIQEIADILGLSRNTVSKALNGHYVPQKTRELILRVAQELNYQSMNDLMLRNKKELHILLLSGTVLNNINYFASVLKGLENYCFDNNIQLYQHTFNGSLSSISSVKESVEKFKIDGILCAEILNNELVNQLLKFDVPVCFIDFPVTKFFPKGNYDIILPECGDKLKLLLNDFIANYGINNISFIGDCRHCLSFNERYQSTLAIVVNNKLEHSTEDDIIDAESIDFGNPATIKYRIIKQKIKSKLFVCGNDFIAKNVIDALYLMGKKVPEDVMVIGFDNSKESQSNTPSITTIGINHEALGKLAVTTLVNRILNSDLPSTTIRMTSEAFIRESTKK